MMDQLDLVGRTAELARTYGIEYTSVMTRGSQYRVESLMSRLAHTQNFLLVSPSRESVARQPAMACLPLVMEPESCMYTSPVVVLDFQSLYPSMMIAYNLCFSTLLGRYQHFDECNDIPPQLGVTRQQHPPGLLREGNGELMPERLVITPNGFAFAPKSVRPGVLPRMLKELLATRVMVKAAMKRHPKSRKARLIPPSLLPASESPPLPSPVPLLRPSQFLSLPLYSPPLPFLCLPSAPPASIEGAITEVRLMPEPAAPLPAHMCPAFVCQVLQRVLNARQFALKMISNVTYGYTSAGFSGRMPCAELADAIVSSGRDTLERCIQMVNDHPTWGARVVYGDTDSMFVLLEGRSKEEAFRIGAEIAAAATAANPSPVMLKMEKVYLPCVLQTKKRRASDLPILVQSIIPSRLSSCTPSSFSSPPPLSLPAAPGSPCPFLSPCR